MTMATRIVVMKDGYIQQVGTPKDIYDYPNNVFVGGFIGTPPMNFIEGRVTEKGYFEVGDHKLGLTRDRKSTRLNSSHVRISYAVFCLKKKTTTKKNQQPYKIDI